MVYPTDLDLISWYYFRITACVELTMAADGRFRHSGCEFGPTRLAIHPLSPI